MSDDENSSDDKTRKVVVRTHLPWRSETATLLLHKSVFKKNKNGSIVNYGMCFKHITNTLMHTHKNKTLLH